MIEKIKEYHLKIDSSKIALIDFSFILLSLYVQDNQGNILEMTAQSDKSLKYLNGGKDRDNGV